uniref:RING-type domain-containing protein n=1 Tax=Davidia involucrata TaxID=16924 RepID=A0A5B7AHL8_DAVIN
MGSACCVAARDTTLPNRSGGETLHRNAIYSPSWSFRWDNRRRVAGEIEDPSYRLSHEISRDGSMEMKRELGLDGDTFSGGRSPSENFGTPMSQKSPVHEGQDANPITHPSDLSMAGNDNAEVQSSIESLEIVNKSAPKLSFSLPSCSSFSTPTANPLSSRTRSLPANSTQSRRAHRSPGHQLLRQVSDSRILGLKSPNNNLVSEGRPSFVLSTCSNDLTTGSQGGSSDGWSMRSFSELVASSQKERWSFDSECLGSGRGKISESSNRFSYSPSSDLQTCGACSKLLIERSSWSSQKIIASNELSVVAVLVCGHAYHAECLETMTLEADQYDPSCPVCMVGEKQILKMSRKALRAAAELKSRSSKISRNRVVDSYLNAGFDILDRQKNSEREGKFPKMEPSSSARSSFAKPFLRRHFSVGSKWSRSLSENDSCRKKGFWARYRKD